MTGIKLKNVVVYGLYCEDLPAALHFYRDVIGLRLLPHHGERPAFELDRDSHLVILRGAARPGLEPREASFPVLALAVENLDEAVAALREKKVEMPWGIEENNQARWIKFYDPGNNLIELAEFKAGRAAPTTQNERGEI